MFLRFNNFRFLKFFHADNGSGSGITTPNSDGGSGGGTKEDMIDFMGDDDPEDIIDLEDKPVGKEKGKSKSPDKEKVKEDKGLKIENEDVDDTDDEDEPEIEVEDDLDELEKELSGPTDDQLELIAPVRRKEILKKYPELFKDFPYLERAYYREQKYTELLPTIKDAEEAVGKSQTLDRFEIELIGKGDTVNILKAVKEENPRSFHRIVDNYLSTLAQVDEKSYHHVLGNTIKHTIISMVKEGERSNNDALRAAAQVLNQFVFGSSDFSPPTNLSKDNEHDDSKLREVKQRENQIVRNALQGTINDLNTRVNNALTNTIEANIDPKKTMTDYIRSRASRDAQDAISELISKDTRFKALTDKLWERAISSNFAKADVDRIRSAYVSKSRTLLPSVIKKARNDALKGMGRKIKEDTDDTNDSTSSNKRSPDKVEKPSSGSKGKISKASDIPKDMKTLDFLMQD